MTRYESLTSEELELLERCLVALHATAAIREPGERISMQLPAEPGAPVSEPAVHVVAYRCD